MHTTISPMGTGTMTLIESGGHPADIGTRLNNVPDQYSDEHGVQQPAGIISPDDGEESLPRHLPQFRAQINHGKHHGKGDGRNPQERRPESSARRRQGSDRGRIVVRRPGNQPQPQRAEYALRRGFDGAAS
jgi:hypothetical protein